MQQLPRKFLLNLNKTTDIAISNLSRYLSGGVTPRPDRAEFLSESLLKHGIFVPPEVFIFRKSDIKKIIIKQLNNIKYRKHPAHEAEKQKEREAV